jgi:outer membrane protein/protease secretion system outer membrane protein
MVESVPRIHAYEQAQRSAEQMVLSNQMSFKAGSRTVMDVLNAEQQRMVTRRDLMQSRLQYVLARVRLNAMLDGGGQTAIVAISPLFADK